MTCFSRGIECNSTVHQARNRIRCSHNLFGVATMSGSGRDKPRTGHCGSYHGMLHVGAEAAPVLGINGMTEIDKLEARQAAIDPAMARRFTATRTSLPEWMRHSESRRRLLRAADRARFGGSPQIVLTIVIKARHAYTQNTMAHHVLESSCKLLMHFLLGTHAVPESDT